MKTKQQGDVLITKIDKLPTGLEKQKDLIIQHGESTGHAHRLNHGEIFFHPKEKVKYLRLVKEAIVSHEEHDPLTLPEGEYQIGIVREKGMFDDLIAPVVD